jgi:hypothetical protein
MAPMRISPLCTKLQESFKVVMSKNPYSWKLVVLKGQVACVLGRESDQAYLLTMRCRFQVPHVEGGSAKGFHTLQLEADKSVMWPIDCGTILFLTLVAGHPEVRGLAAH